ncbi:MAG: sigma-70 family RNA polymerase sigma factor [Acidobacteriota bacterium]
MIATEQARRAPSDDPLRPLLERMAQGDRDALAELYDATRARVHGWTTRVLRDRALAEEATLDTYLQCWREADRHDPGRGSVLGWLSLLARSRALDLARRQARRSRREESVGELPDAVAIEGSPEQCYESTVRAARVQDAIARLPVGQQQVLQAAFYQGLSHSEAAEALGQPLGTVKTRIRSAMSRLRDELEGLT